MMTSSISYLTQRTDFKEVDPEVPLTKSRPKDKVDPPKVFEGGCIFLPFRGTSSLTNLGLLCVENKKELMVDLVRKAKQIELLINSLPVLEPEETQAARFAQLEEEMQVANLEYKTALERARMPSAHFRRLMFLHVALRDATQRDNSNATNIDRYARRRAELVCRSRFRLWEGLGHHLYQFAQCGGGDEHYPPANVRSERIRPLAWFTLRKVVVTRVQGNL
jgi:mediator of RNA polymerase II transcription subunit 21